MGAGMGCNGLRYMKAQVRKITADVRQARKKNAALASSVLAIHSLQRGAAEQAQGATAFSKKETDFRFAGALFSSAGREQEECFFSVVG